MCISYVVVAPLLRRLLSTNPLLISSQSKSGFFLRDDSRISSLEERNIPEMYFPSLGFPSNSVSPLTVFSLRKYIYAFSLKIGSIISLELIPPQVAYSPIFTSLFVGARLIGSVLSPIIEHTAVKFSGISLSLRSVLVTITSFAVRGVLSL